PSGTARFPPSGAATSSQCRAVDTRPSCQVFFLPVNCYLVFRLSGAVRTRSLLLKASACEAAREEAADLPFVTLDCVVSHCNLLSVIKKAPSPTETKGLRGTTPLDRITPPTGDP